VEPEGTERRLAAILSADVVSYSRLMAEDEAATVRTLSDYREEIGLLVRQHRGRVVDTAGDSLLAEFPAATEAVSCAIEIQGSLGVRNAALTPERRMAYCAKTRPTRNANNSGILEPGMVAALGLPLTP